MTQPDDREMDEYLEGGSKLSQRYREASRETAPPALDEIVLARARAEARRPASLNRWLAPVAVAASLVLAVNLGWNVWRAEPMPKVEPKPPRAATEGFVPEPGPAPAPEDRAPAPPAPERGSPAAQREPVAPETSEQAETVERQVRARQEAARQAEAARDSSRKSAEADAGRVQEERIARSRRQDEATAPSQQSAPAASSAPPAAWTEQEKIERLIQFVAGLGDVTFVRNGKDYPAADAAKHMRLKLDKAGDRVQTADDFIRLCASRSYMSGEPYLMRFPDGRTRTSEEVLREHLATMP